MAQGIFSFRIRNLGLKVLALVLSLLLWYLATDSRLRSKVINRVPLQFQSENLPPNMYHEISGERFSSFKVLGPSEDIASLTADNFMVRIPLQSVSVGPNTIPIRREMIAKINLQDRVKKRVVVLPGSIVPDQITIDIAYYQREVPIEVVTSGDPAPGHHVKETQITPETVLVTGSPDELDKITEIPTDTLDITNIESNVTVDVMLNFKGLSVQPVSEASRQVRVNFVVQKK
ncbi:MAG TPA: CdaR family protein [bacterium]|nr:CdaR family protein [bacterium]